MCKHDFAPLIAKKGEQTIEVQLLRVCLNCGMLKVGKHTIKLSKDRLDMDSKPIRNIGQALIVTSGRLKVPVGTDLYS